MRNDLAAPNDGPKGNAWSRFWFTPSPMLGLHVLRVSSGLLFSSWLLSFLGHEQALFSLNGWFDRESYIQVQQQPDMAPAPIGWSILYLAGNSESTFLALYVASIAVLVLFTLGICTRVTGVLSWVVVVSFLANPATSYEADYLLAILAFYLMLGYVLAGQWNGELALWERILGSRLDVLGARWFFAAPANDRPLSYAANLAMRLLQIHFAIIMVASGLHKLQISDWWSGVALWYPLHPPLRTTADSLRQEAPNAMCTFIFLSLIQYGVLAWQLCLPIFAWRENKWCRSFLLMGAFYGWIGLFFIYKLPLFGPFVMLGAMSYLSPREWAAVGAFAERMVGMATGSRPALEQKTPAAVAGRENVKS